jgi:hypothetical protein
MNAPQRIVLLLAVVAVTLMMLFPHWLFVYDDSSREYIAGRIYITRPAGYHAIWGEYVPSDPTALRQLFGFPFPVQQAQMPHFSMRLDKDRLVVQIGATLIVAALLLLLFKRDTIKQTEP